MRTLISRATKRSFWGGPIYRLSVKIVVDDPDHRKIIARDRLHRIEVFTDPLADECWNAAEVAHEHAKSHGLFVWRLRDAAAVTGAEISALSLSRRAMNAFSLSVADLLRGVTIEQRSLRDIADIERVCIELTDRLYAAVAAAGSYNHRTEDVFAPSVEHDDTVPPGQWTLGWRR